MPGLREREREGRLQAETPVIMLVMVRLVLLLDNNSPLLVLIFSQLSLTDVSCYVSSCQLSKFDLNFAVN